MRNLTKIIGLFLLLSSAYGSFNLYLNEHETMRLLGEFQVDNKKIKIKNKKNFNEKCYFPRGQ